MSIEDKYYQVSEGYLHRKVANNDVLISVGANIANFNGYITLNSTASFLWDVMSTPQSARQLVQALIEEFDVSEETAQQDVEAFLQMLQKESMITECSYEIS
ncbi:MAG: PqqD family protein [Lachnospiraceae bacterium]|nr:PqqD family protein [Lachnospiraceae bacterium]